MEKKVTSAFRVHPSNEGKGAYPIKAKHRWQVQPCARVILKRLRIRWEQLARRATAPYHFSSSLVGGCLKKQWPWLKTLSLDECPFNLRLILWPLQKLFTILKVGKWAKSALLLMSIPRRYSPKNIAVRAAWPAQTSAVVLSHWDVVMSEFNHSFRPSAEHVMYISKKKKKKYIYIKWAAAEALQEPDENFQRIGVKIKNRGEFYSNGLWMPNQYLRRDSDSFPRSQKIQRQVSETRCVNEQPDARRTLHI